MFDLCYYPSRIRATSIKTISFLALQVSYHIAAMVAIRTFFLNLLSLLLPMHFTSCYISCMSALNFNQLKSSILSISSKVQVKSKCCYVSLCSWHMGQLIYRAVLYLIALVNTCSLPCIIIQTIIACLGIVALSKPSYSTPPFVNTAATKGIHCSLCTFWGVSVSTCLPNNLPLCYL